MESIPAQEKYGMVRAQVTVARSTLDSLADTASPGTSMTGRLLDCCARPGQASKQQQGAESRRRTSRRW
jgi:hypothetical protein